MAEVFFVHTSTGDITVYPDKIVRKVKWTQAGPNNPAGEVTIPMNAIIQVDVNENGFQKLLTFKTADTARQAGIWAGKNSQAFPRKYYAEAEKIKEYVQNIISQRGTESTTIIQQTSAADELRKFKELLDSGVISQEEFDAKKKQILGL